MTGEAPRGWCDECELPAHARGKCSTHYMAMRRAEQKADKEARRLAEGVSSDGGSMLSSVTLDSCLPDQGDTPGEAERQPAVKIPSLRGALKEGLSDQELADLLERQMRLAADAEKPLRLLCPECGKKPYFNVPDWTARLNAWRFLIETTDGRTPTAEPPQKPKTVGKDFEDMTDDELTALLGEGETDAD